MGKLVVRMHDMQKGRASGHVGGAGSGSLLDGSRQLGEGKERRPWLCAEGVGFLL